MNFRNSGTFERGDLCRKSREQANVSIPVIAEFLKLSTRMIDFYEAGESPVPDDKLLKMAELYGDPLLPWNYWTINSPIAKHYGFKPFTDKTIYSAAIEAGNSFNVISRDREDFMVIMEDGRIDDNERPKYEEIVGASKKASLAVLFLDLILNRKEKTALQEAV